LARDLENVESGYYPAALLKQFPLFDYLRVAPGILADVPGLVWRSWTRSTRNIPQRIEAEAYPAYYRQAFHWQKDGWLSAHSARVYDVGVDFLFLGTADAMRRLTIPPLLDALRGNAAPRLLDVGCGTGRYLRQLHQALPRAKLYGLDLSPYYVAESRRQLAEVPHASFAVENAEKMPFGEATFDGATAIFLFHELPRDVRRRVMREVGRVLAPGAPFVVCESVQEADRDARALVEYMEWFPRLYHEPYFKDYVRDDLGAALEECGFEVIGREAVFLSTVVVARRR
jgi:ubiquinone/menaquinone biosynthesis C-methylase UbiE